MKIEFYGYVIESDDIYSVSDLNIDANSIGFKVFVRGLEPIVVWRVDYDCNNGRKYNAEDSLLFKEMQSTRNKLIDIWRSGQEILKIQ